MQVLYLVRGLPGCGKSTEAKRMALPVFEADQYFIDENGVYQFDPSKLEQAHLECQRKTKECLKSGQDCIVANTFTTRWEMLAYVDMANELDIYLKIIDLYDGGCSDEVLAERNTHGVPLATIKRMRDRWQDVVVERHFSLITRDI